MWPGLATLNLLDASVLHIHVQCCFSFLFSFFFPFFFYFLYCSGFCHTLKWNSHGFTCVPHPDAPHSYFLFVFVYCIRIGSAGNSSKNGNLSLCLSSVSWSTQNTIHCILNPHHMCVCVCVCVMHNVVYKHTHSNLWHRLLKFSKWKWTLLSSVRLFATPWTVAHQAPLSMGFSRPEYWSGLPFPSPGDLPNSGIEPRSPTWQADSLPAEPPGKPKNTGVASLSLLQGIFPTQESNQGLLHCRWILYQLSYQENPRPPLINLQNEDAVTYRRAMFWRTWNGILYGNTHWAMLSISRWGNGREDVV